MEITNYAILNEEQFQALITKRIYDIQNTLISKGQEYVRNGDRLWNFRETARREGSTMLEALNGMMAKHVTSFHDMITDVKNGKNIPQKFLDDKIVDLLNYHLLAEAIVVEHNQNL